jgi:hypothetical protein
MLGGESVELSVLFTDIKEFTPFAERITPDKLAEILGRYLQVMATVIQNEKGTIDKFIGDAVMAFWNAPEAVAGPFHPRVPRRAEMPRRLCWRSIESPANGRVRRDLKRASGCTAVSHPSDISGRRIVSITRPSATASTSPRVSRGSTVSTAPRSSPARPSTPRQRSTSSSACSTESRSKAKDGGCHDLRTCFRANSGHSTLVPHRLLRTSV